MIKNPASLKQSAASVTEWLNKVWGDLFLRTEIIIIGTLFFLCFANVAIIAVAFHKLHLDIATIVISSITEVIMGGDVSLLNATSTTAMLFANLTDVRDVYLTVIAAVSVIITLLFGYIVARIALAPTRNALIAQKQFIANIAHELRTPLSIIKANSEILLLQKGQDTESEEMIKSNIEELDRVSGIINNLLTLNTFRHAQHLNFQWVNLGEITEDAVHKLEHFARSKNIRLALETDDTHLVRGNKSAIAQITMNLVKNAIVYTPKEGLVRITTRNTSATSVMLEVVDNGIGIEREKLRRVFEPFYQVDPSRSKKSGSSGLGLAIVSELVKFHNGKIAIQSTPQEGTRVTVEFPSKDKGTITEGNTNGRPATGEIVMDFSKSSQ